MRNKGIGYQIIKKIIMLCVKNNNIVFIKNRKIIKNRGNVNYIIKLD